MQAIDRKLLRDLWNMKGQALAIALVIAAGIAMFITYLSTFDSLQRNQQNFYERQNFADVFASLKRAPQDLARRIGDLPGVAQVDTRVVADVNLAIEGLNEPATGRLVSIRLDRPNRLNGFHLLRGRLPEAGHPEEVLVSEGFAVKRQLDPGSQIAAVINGRQRQLEIVGIALSPEYIYTIRPGELIPDESRFGIFWMEHRALANAFDMEGGFNDVALSLMLDAQTDEVISRLDRLIEPYGGLGAIPRDLQLSHWYVDNELSGLQGAGLILPTIFLLVAAFLLNVVLNRIVKVQREQIAALKALGYSNLELGRHYAAWSVLIALIGVVLGIAGGSWLGSAMTDLYGEYFRFPVLEYEMTTHTLVIGLLISVAAALIGAWGAVRQAINLPPAEAMRPEPPARYHISLVERLGIRRWLSQPARMVLRNLERQPGRALATITGIAFAAAILVVGLFWIDSMDVMMDAQFNVIQRQDVTVTFFEPVSASAAFELNRLPGVLYSEMTRNVPVRLRHQHHSRQVSLTGVAEDAALNRVVDASLRPVELPPEGLVLSATLAEILQAERGDQVTLEVLEGRRPVIQLPIIDLVDDYQGMAAYMRVDALHRLLREGNNLSGGLLKIDAAQTDELYRQLKAIPKVAGVSLKAAAIESFETTIAQNMGVMIFFNVLFASIIAFGVIYNAARISLSERSRELATLRVVGFNRGEISFILLGELAVLTLIALPLGLGLGYGLAALAIQAYNSELVRFPLVIGSSTLFPAVASIIAASAISGWIVRRKLDHLDLIGVLKTRE